MVSATSHAIAYYFKAVLVGVILFLITATMIDGGAEGGGLLFGALVVLGWPFIMTVLLFHQVGSVVDDKLQEQRAARAQANRHPRQKRQSNSGKRQSNSGKRRTTSDIDSGGQRGSNSGRR